MSSASPFKIPVSVFCESINGAVSRRAAIVCLALLLAFSGGTVLGQVSNFVPTGGGTFDWNLGGNWSAGIPNGNGHVANWNADITGNQVLNLNQNVTLGILNIGDSNGSHSQALQAGTFPGAAITFDDAVGASQINKGGGNTTTISAAVSVLDRLNVSANSGNLILTGGMTIGGPGTDEWMQKLGGGTMQILGNFNLLNTSGQSAFPTRGVSVAAGTLVIGGAANTISNEVHMAGGALNMGVGTPAATATSVVFTPGQGSLNIEGGTVNFGVAGTTADTSTNVSIDIDRIAIFAGALNLQNSTNGTGGSGTTGVTTLNAGATGTLTLDGGTTTVARTDGAALGSVVLPSNAKLVMNGTSVFHFTDSTGVAFTVNGIFTGGTNQITVLDASTMVVGQTVTGTNIPGSTTITAIAGNVITLNNNTTGTGVQNITNLVVGGVAQFHASTTSGSNVINMLDTTGFAVGQTITGQNIPANSVITAVAANSVTISLNAYGTSKNSTYAANQNYHFQGLTSTANGTILRSAAGNGTLTVGGDGVNDAFAGSLNMASSGGNSRLIKMGTETLMLSGTVDNTSARLEVKEGTVVLAKTSAPAVHALGGPLTLGDTVASPFSTAVEIGGSYVGTGGTMGVANFRDQIFRTTTATLNSGSILDLKGNFEGLDVLTGTGTVRSSTGSGTLLVGENNSAFTFSGTLVDGGGQLSFWKGGAGDVTLTANNTYTGDTRVARNTLILTGANGALTGTSDVLVTRFSSLRLDNHLAAGGINNNNRINDAANIILDQGELRFIRDNSNGINTTEVIGDLTVRGSSILRMDHTGIGNGAANRANILTLTFDSYNRDAGGTLMVFDQNASKFSTTTPQTAGSRVTLATLPGAGLLAGTTVASSANAPDTKILIGAYGGTSAGRVNDFVTVQTEAGVHYITPLAAGDYNSAVSGAQNATNIPVVFGAGTFDDNVRTTGGISISANQAFNAWRQSGLTAAVSTTTLAEGKFLHLGGLAALPGHNPTLDGSGMVYLIGDLGDRNQAITIEGGTLDFGGREAIIRSEANRINQSLAAVLTNNSTTVTGVNSDGMGIGDRVTGTNIGANAEIVQIIEGGTGNADTIILNVPAQQSETIGDLNVFANHRIDSRIMGSSGLTKNGGNTLEITGNNLYTGATHVTDGDLRIFTDTALGAGGLGNGTVINASRVLTLNSGISVKNEDLTLLGNSLIQVIDRNNNWQGNILINPTDAAGQNVNMTIRAQGNSILTVNGSLTTPAASNPALGLYTINPTYEQEAGGQQFILENYGGAGGIMNFNGKISDIGGTSAAAGARHEELNIVVRGFTGQSVTTNSDFVVNLDDVSAVNGRLDLRTGYVHIASDFGGNNPIATRGAAIRLHDFGNVDRSNSVGGLLMTEPGTVFRGGQIIVGTNEGSYSSKSTAIIGGLANSGLITFGTDSGSMDMTPIAGSATLNAVTSTKVNSTINVNSASSANTASGATTITMTSVAGLAIGQGISGPGIAANTRITNIVGNDITLSIATNAVANAGTSYTYNLASLSAADTANNSETIAVGSVAGLNVGDGISGAGIRAGTRISAIDSINNIITITRPTTSAQSANTVYSFYDAAASTIQMVNTAGLRVGMGLGGTGIPVGATIVAITPGALPTDPGTITLSTPLGNFAGSNTGFTLPLPAVAYQTTNRTITVGQPNASGQNQLQLYSVAGLSVGTSVSGTGIPGGARITAINTATDTVTLSGNLTANVQNTAINFQKASNFAESRLYSPEGGLVDFQMRAIDDGGFSLQNEVGALAKVGRGTVKLSGSAAGAGDVDGGFNLFGGTLQLSYDNVLRGNSRVNGIANNTTATAISTDPYQLTLAGGDMLLTDDEARNTVESFRGTLTIRPGHSVLQINGANSSQITLHLGYNNDFPVGTTAANPLPDPNLYWREPDRFAGGTMEIFYDGTGGGAARVFYSQNAPQGQLAGNLGFQAVVPYAPIRLGGGGLPGDHVDFSILFPVADLTSGGSSTIFADAEGVMTGVNAYDPFGNYPTGQGDLNLWAGAVAGNNYGYLTDAYLGALTGFSNSLAANSGTDFVGARVIRFVGDVADNTLELNPGTRLVVGSNGEALFLNVGDPVRDGGAILVSDLVSRTAAHDQFIKGGSVTSAYGSTYFSQSVMPGPYTREAAPAFTSTDLMIFNHNEAGVLHIESSLVNYDARPMNLVLSGPGTTHLNPATSNNYTGITYVNDSTLWVSDGSKFGNGTGGIYMNGGALEFAHDTAANRDITAISPTLSSTRDIVLGGDGGTIKISAPGTTLTYGGIVRSEDNILPIRLAEHNMTQNFAVGDLIKEGGGRLVLTNDVAVNGTGWNAYYGLTEVNDGTLQVNITTTDSGILGSNDSNLDRTIVRGGGKLDLQMNSINSSTNEWIDLQGGILGTTISHVDGKLNGVITAGANNPNLIKLESALASDVLATDVVLRSVAGLNVGDSVTGPGISPGTTISVVNTLTNTITLSQATSSAVPTNTALVFGASNASAVGAGATTVTLSSVAGLNVGDKVINAGVPSGTVVSAINVGTKTVTLSQPTSAPIASGVSISFTEPSTVLVQSGQKLRFNTDAGYLTGAGDLIKEGDGQLFLTENSPDFSGDWRVNLGTIIGRSQGTPLGQGGKIFLGSTGPASAVAEIFLESRTTAATFNTEYVVDQDIIVNLEGAGTQVKRIGARDFDDSVSGGQQHDRYAYKGDITLNDDLFVSYVDDKNNPGIAAGGADRFIALDGNLLAGNGSLITEITYNGGHVAGADKDLRITTELSGDNSAWTGNLLVGNASSDSDLQHIARLGSNNALGADNDVVMGFNNAIQAGGKTATAGNLLITPGSIAAGTGAGQAANGIIIENAGNAPGTLTFAQDVNERWDALFRDGVTPEHYAMPTLRRDGSLSIGKDGLAVAVLTQNNTYSGTTLVNAGTLQVGDGGTAEAVLGSTGPGGIGNGMGETGLGGTTLGSGGMLSGTGLVNGLRAQAYSSISTTVGSNVLVFSDPANLSIGQTVTSASLNGGSGMITAIDQFSITVNTTANATGLSATANVTTNHMMQGLLSPGDSHQLGLSTGAVVAGASVIPVNNVSGLAVGMRIDGIGLAANTTIANIVGNNVSLSQNTISAAPGGTGYAFGLAAAGSIGSLTMSGNVDASLATLLLQVAAPTATYGGNLLDLIVGGANYNATIDTIAATFGSTNPAAGSHDHLQFHGDLSIGGDTLVRVVDAGHTYAAGEIFNFFDWSSIFPGSFDVGGAVRGGGQSGDLELPDLPGALSWDTSKLLSDGLAVVVSVPEPGRCLMSILGLASLLLRRSRRLRFPG